MVVEVLQRNCYQETVADPIWVYLCVHILYMSATIYVNISSKTWRVCGVQHCVHGIYRPNHICQCVFIKIMACVVHNNNFFLNVRKCVHIAWSLPTSHLKLVQGGRGNRN